MRVTVIQMRIDRDSRARNQRRVGAWIEQAIDMDPGSAGPRAYCEIGRLHLRARRLEEAREVFDNAEIHLDRSGRSGSGAFRLRPEPQASVVADLLCRRRLQQMTAPAAYPTV